MRGVDVVQSLCSVISFFWTRNQDKGGRLPEGQVPSPCVFSRLKIENRIVWYRQLLRSSYAFLVLDVPLSES